MRPTTALLKNELRAVIPVWLAASVGLFAGHVPGARMLHEFEILAYVYGALALGAVATGHDYRYRTLTQLLVQPVARARILAIKIGVLGVALAALAATAFVATFASFRWHGPHRLELLALAILPPAYGLFVAPWLALKTRNMLAGSLFAGALGATLFLAGYRIATAAYGREAEAAIVTFKVTFLFVGSGLLCLASAAGLWRSFATLEVLDSPAADIALPSLLPRRADAVPGRSHPLLRLAGKELRLQQLTFAASLIYVLLYLIMWLKRDAIGDTDVFVLATVIHAIVVAALIGALSCAEERALGTLEWQLLQPMPARVQFAVKVATSIALLVILAIGLPQLLAGIFGGLETWPQSRQPRDLMIIVTLLAGSIYLSTVAANAMVALFLCIPAFAATSFFITGIAYRVAGWLFVELHVRGAVGRAVHPIGEGAHLLIWAVFVCAVLWCAFENHRTASRSLRRTSLQLAGLAVLFTAVATGLAVAGRWL